MPRKKRQMQERQRIRLWYSGSPTWKRMHKIAICGELTLEETTSLPQDKLRNEWMNVAILQSLVHWTVMVKPLLCSQPLNLSANKIQLLQLTCKFWTAHNKFEDNVTTCSLTNLYQRFGETCCSGNQGKIPTQKMEAASSSQMFVQYMDISRTSCRYFPEHCH